MLQTLASETTTTTTTTVYVNMLANISSEKAVSLPKATANNPLPLKIRTMAQPRESSSVTVCSIFFSEAVI